MPFLIRLSALGLITALGACATTTPTTPAPTTPSGPPPLPSGAIGNVTESGGDYAIEANSTSYDLGTPVITVNDDYRFNGAFGNATFTYGAVARGYSKADVDAMGGMLSDGTAFSGVTGTAATSLPSTGTATYLGRFSMVYESATPGVLSATSGGMSLTADFDAMTVVGNPSPAAALSVSGAITGSTFAGTASCNYSTCSATVAMEGGFYGANGVAGAFAGTGLAGAFYAE